MLEIKSKLLFCFLLMALVSGVSATECNTSLTIISQYSSFRVNEIMQFGVYSSPISNDTIKNLDLDMLDPDGNRVVDIKGRYNTTFDLVNFNITVSDAYINGRYVIEAFLYHYNMTNQTTLLCEKAARFNVTFNTNRTTYTNLPMILTASINYSTQWQTVCSDTTQGSTRITICANGSMPVGYNISFESISLPSFDFSSSGNLTLTTGQLFYNASFVEVLFNQLKNAENDTAFWQSKTTEHYYQVKQLLNNTDNCLMNLNLTQTQNNILSQQSSMSIQQLTTCQRDYLALKENPYDNSIRFFWGFVGAIVGIALLTLYVMWKSSRTPHNL